jgi:hypothetical protein
MKDPFATDTDRTSAAGSSLALISVVNAKRVEKYGASFSQEGKCDVTAADLVPTGKTYTCASLWKSDGQTIHMYWVVKNNRVSSLALVYKPLESDI